MGLEVGGAAAPLYGGVYEVTLNTMVTVVVVPDTGLAVEAWDPDVLPEDFDAIAEVAVARRAAALAERYVLTVGDSPGTHRFRWLGDEPGERTGVASVVDPSTFAQVQRDLADLASFLGAVVPDHTMASLRGRPSIEHIVELEEWMAPEDLRWLRDGGSAGG
jgi:hypothetical protein